MRFFTKLSDFFKGLFGRKPQKSDPLTEFIEREYNKDDLYYKDIFEIAKAVSEGDPEVTSVVRFVLDEPIKYFRERAQKYLERGIDFDNENFYDEFMLYDLLELASIDEMESRGYVSRVSIECGLSEFWQALTKIKGYEKIKNVADNFEFNIDGDIAVWTEEINAELGGAAYIAFIIEIIEEKFALAITNRETSEKINGEITE